MTDRLSRMESELRELRRNLDYVERRLGALESSHAEHRKPEPVERARDSEDAPTEAVDSTRLVTLTGRTFMILGVGHLLRAITASGAVPPMAGTALGLVYALSWLLLARRAVARGRLRSANAYGIGSAAIAFPLLWEAVSRFDVFPAAVGAAAAALFGIFFLVLAARWGLYAFASVAALSSVGASLALLAQSRDAIPCALSVFAIAAASLWVAWRRQWRLLPWMTAAAANLAAFGVAVGVGLPKNQIAPFDAQVIGLGLLALYLVGSIVRLSASESEGRSLSTFEIIQSVMALVIGYGGAVTINRTSGSGAGLIVIVSVVLIVAVYASSIGGIAGGRLDRPAFSHLTSVALALVMVSSWLALPMLTVVVFWSALAVAGPILSDRLHRRTFGLHGAVALLGAAFVSGLLAASVRAFTTSPASVTGHALPASVWVVLAAALAGLWFFAVAPPDAGRTRGAVPRIVFWGILLMGAGALVVRALIPVIAVGDGALSNLATLRTTLLVGAVILLAVLSRSRRFTDARWLVYPFLVVTAVKLVAEDLPQGRPTNLFLSLGLFGLSLVIAARLLAHRSPKPTDSGT